MIYNCASHIGKVRKNNEDYCKGEIIDTDFGSVGINIIEFLKENLLQSSNIKIDYIDDIIKQAYHNVNNIIYEKSMSSLEFEGMGTTLVIAIIYKNNLYVANVGDSRCYLLNENGFNKITIDHSVVEELVKANIITEEEAKTHPRRNHITRAIGTDEMVIVDIFKKQIDGLTGFVDDNTIKDTLLKDEDVNDLTKELINTANDVSGRDNISVILIEEK